MDWRHRLRPFAARPSIRAGVPKAVLDHLLLDSPLPPGAAILDAGCRSGKLVRTLLELGFDACGAVTSPTDWAAARRRCPEADLRLLDESGFSVYPPASFRMVIARNLLPTEGSRLDATVRSRVVDWLRLVAPGGELVILESPQDTEGRMVHRRECTLGLLGCFGSETRLASIRGGWFQRGLGGPAGAEYVCTHLRVPGQPVEADHWSRVDRSLDQRPWAPCCDGDTRANSRGPSRNSRASVVDPARRAA